ncbi:hypothetical protein J0H58_20770 [bacterium]|nr:hypothetical protein [bacterium]
MRPALAPRRAHVAAVIAGVVALAAPGSVRAAFVADSSAQLVQDTSTSGIGKFSGTIAVDNINSGTAMVRVSLTNTSPKANGGYITGFAFNLPVPLASATLTTAAPSSFNLAGGGTFDNAIGNYDDVPGQPFGFFDVGAGLGADGSLNSGSPTSGLAVGQTGTFTFTLTSNPGQFDLNQLSAELLLSLASANPQGGGAQAFLVRFRGFKNGGSDKVVINPDGFTPPPPPPGVPAPPAVLLALAGVGCLLGRGAFRRKPVPTA